MRIIIAAEKPSTSQFLAPHVRQHWPDATIVCVHVGPYSNIKFAYPRGLKFNEYPHISEPRNRLSSWSEWNCAAQLVAVDGSVAKLPMGPELLAGADLVVFACDPDHTGATSFSVFMEQVYGAGSADACPALWIAAMDDASIKQGLSNLAPFGQVGKASLEYGLAKRYFDWNWNVNSLGLLGRAQRLAGAPADAPPLSKYALQLLYALRGRELMTDGDIAQLMVRWPGSGKYEYGHGEFRPRLGCAASFGQILKNLRLAGLLAGESRELRISDAGLALLDRLHPDCEDVDLPFRIDAWCKRGLAESRPAIDRYVRTFFGKQVRFAAKES